jgi:hypothetical protein
MLRPFAYKMLVEYGQKTVAKARAKLMRKPLPASSDLVKSIKYKVFQNGSVEFEFNESGIFVDKGRRKGAKPPPVKPIADWARKKGIDASPYAIAKSIGKKGIKKYPWIYTSFPDDRNPNSRASRDLEVLWEEITLQQLEFDLNQLED